jgi:glycosyltransferase involved in cell wall biosynthesis
MVDVAIVSNEPTPYRIHVLERLAREIPEARFHNIFTHGFAKASMPWKVSLGSHLNPVFFERHHLGAGGLASRRAWKLHHDIREYIEKHGIDLVMLHGYNDLARLGLIRWARRRGLPLLLTGDSNVMTEGRVAAWARPIKRAYLRWVVNSVAGLMPMGTCGRAYFRSYVDHDRPEFLFPYEPDYGALAGVEPAAVEAFRVQHGLLPGHHRLLYCGRLAPAKRVDVLLDAFAAIAPRRPDWDLAIAGSGPLEAELRGRVPAGLRGRVHWLGFLQFEQTRLCYHACDVLVLPSEYEPWALVINEAVACGLAVVATSVVGAAVELVRHRHNGLIVPPRSVSAMIEALEQITCAEVCEQMRRRAPGMLEAWRTAADPVDGVRQALRHFGHWPAGGT